jgi:hypothetical protein
MHERDLRREKRILAHECLRAVDRIDQPQILRIDRALPGFLAVKSMRREALADDATDHLLGLDIGLSDRRLVSLQRDLQVALVITTNDFGAGARRVECCREKF